MTPHENSEIFINEYFHLVDERDQTEFQKVLEMKVREMRNVQHDTIQLRIWCIQ